MVVLYCNGMTHSFSINEAIRFGWHTLKSHSALVFQVVLTMLALEVASAIVQKVLVGTALGTIAYTVLTLVQAYIGAGAMLIALRLSRSEHAHYRQLFLDWRLAVRYILSGILAGIATFVPIFIGAVIAILTGLATLGNFVSFSEGGASPVAFGAAGIAGIIAILVIAIVTLAAAAYIALRYSMSRFEVLDGACIVESLRKSTVITRGVKWKLLGFMIVAILLNILGALLLLVGLLVTIPVTMLAMAHVYTKLKSHHHHA